MKVYLFIYKTCVVNISNVYGRTPKKYSFDEWSNWKFTMFSSNDKWQVLKVRIRDGCTLARDHPYAKIPHSHLWYKLVPIWSDVWCNNFLFFTSAHKTNCANNFVYPDIREWRLFDMFPSTNSRNLLFNNSVFSPSINYSVFNINFDVHSQKISLQV